MCQNRFTKHHHHHSLFSEQTALASGGRTNSVSEHLTNELMCIQMGNISFFKALLSTDQDRARFKVEGNLILDLNGLSTSRLVILLSLRPLKFHNVPSKSQIYSERNHLDRPLRECDECPFSCPLNSGSTHIKYLSFISYSN